MHLLYTKLHKKSIVFNKKNKFRIFYAKKTDINAFLCILYNNKKSGDVISPPWFIVI